MNRTQAVSSTAVDTPYIPTGDAWQESGRRFDAFAQASARTTTRKKQRASLTTRGAAVGDTITLAGNGVGLRIEHDALVIQHGVTYSPQEARTTILYRGVHTVSHIVCVHPSGCLTFAAQRWCQEQGVCLVMIGRDGAHDGTLTPDSPAHIELRRAQYAARASGLDVALARALLVRKVASAVDALNALDGQAEKRALQRAHEAHTLALNWLNCDPQPDWLASVRMLRTYEGRCASTYFNAYGGIPLPWAAQDAKGVPPYWLRIGSRSSPLSHNGMAHHAVDPFNATLNYAYALLESSCRVALAREGFDLACGFLHEDKDGRESLVYDLMEGHRARVDQLTLAFLRSVKLHAGDFTRVSDGRCRLHPEMARAVVGACRAPQAEIDESARWLRAVILNSQAGNLAGNLGVVNTAAESEKRGRRTSGKRAG